MSTAQARQRVNRTGRVIGHEGTLEYLRPVDLKVDLSYQRRLNAERVNDLVSEWDDNACGVILVSRRDDGDYTVDGQHRSEAAILMGRGEDTIPCFVQTGLSLQAEADSYWRMNKARLQPSSADTFRARLVAGEEIAVGISQVLDRMGIELRDYPGYLGPNQVYAIGIVESIYRAGDLEWVLGVMREGWRDHAGALRQERLAGFWRFYQAWRRYFANTPQGKDRRAHLIEKLKANGPTQLAEKALEFKISLNSRTATAYARAIHWTHNSHLKTSQNRLPDWPPGEPRTGRINRSPQEGGGTQARPPALSVLQRRPGALVATSGEEGGDNISGMPQTATNDRRPISPVKVPPKGPYEEFIAGSGRSARGGSGR